MPKQPRLGGRLRSLRLKQKLSQRALAERLDISPSYLNLIEHNRRPLPAPMLLTIVEMFGLDLAQFSTDSGARLADALLEVAADPALEEFNLGEAELRDLASSSPDVASAMVRLYERLRATTQTAESLAERLHDHDDDTIAPTVALPSDEVSDMLQDALNYFHQLETAAEELRSTCAIEQDDPQPALVDRLLRQHGVRVNIATVTEMPSTLRRFNRKSKTLMLSEALERPTRCFQLAHQLCLLEYSDLLDAMVSERRLRTPDAKSLARVALANYFAGAVLLPYDLFLAAAEQERYDIERLCHRFRAVRAGLPQIHDAAQARL